MRPQSPSLDVTNDNYNTSSDEYLKLQGNQRLPPKDLPKTNNLSSSPVVKTISKETLEQVSQSHEHNAYHNHMKNTPEVSSENHNNYELNSEQDGTLASSVDIALDYMIGKKVIFNLFYL